MWCACSDDDEYDEGDEGRVVSAEDSTPPLAGDASADVPIRVQIVRNKSRRMGVTPISKIDINSKKKKEKKEKIEKFEAPPFLEPVADSYEVCTKHVCFVTTVHLK